MEDTGFRRHLLSAQSRAWVMVGRCDVQTGQGRIQFVKPLVKLLYLTRNVLCKALDLLYSELNILQSLGTTQIVRDLLYVEKFVTFIISSTLTLNLSRALPSRFKQSSIFDLLTSLKKKKCHRFWLLISSRLFIMMPRALA